MTSFIEPENNQQIKDNFELEIIIKSKRRLTDSEIKNKQNENEQSNAEEEKQSETTYLKVQARSIESDDFLMQRGSKINDDFDEYDFDFEMESRNASNNPSLIG